MMNIIRQFAPDSWGHGNQSDLVSHSEEYQQIMHEVRRAAGDNEDVRARRVIRVQDLHAYGQFLIREQLLINSNDDQLYRVRRYIQVSPSYLNEIVKYNMDPRRTGFGQSLTFHSRLDNFDPDELIVVVKVLTTTPNNVAVNPTTSCDYYVEYIIEVY